MKKKNEKGITNKSADRRMKTGKRMGIVLLVIVILAGGVAGYGMVKKQLSQNDQAAQKTDTHAEGSGDDAVKRYEEQINEIKAQLPDLEKKAKSESVEDLLAYGQALYSAGETVKTEEVYRKLVAQEEQKAEYHILLAEALRNVSKYQESVREFERAIELDSENISYYVNLGRLYQSFMYQKEDAKTVYERIVAKKPDSIEGYLLLAELMEDQNKFTEAIQYYEQAKNIDANNPMIAEGVKRSEDMLGRLNAAGAEDMQ